MCMFSYGSDPLAKIGKLKTNTAISALDKISD